MADYIVSRIQNRRGLQVNLPQPLRQGEFGLCLDTKRLYIGGSPSDIAPGIQILPDYISSAQSILDNQILVGLTDLSFDIDDFRVYMDSQEGISADRIVYSQMDSRVYVGLEVAEIPNTAAILATMLAYSEVTASFSLSLGTIGNDGTISTTTHDEAGKISEILNILAGIGLATTKLNIEVITEATDLNELVLETKTLSPTGVFTDIPGLRFDSQISDIFDITYSLVNVSETYKSTGVMRIVGSNFLSDANLSDDVTEIRDNLEVGIVEFQAIIDAGDVVIQYRSTFGDNLTFKINNLFWQSF